MSNNIIKDNTMIDNECKKLTGIEIESLDIDNTNNINTNKQAYIVKAIHDDGRISNMFVTYCAIDEYIEVKEKLDKRNMLVYDRYKLIYEISSIAVVDINTVLVDVNVDTINEDDEYYNTNGIIVDDNGNFHYDEEKLEDTF